MEIALALVSALLFALGSVLQQKAGDAGSPSGSSSGLLLRMARRPLWLGGIACDGVGYVAQAAALKTGRLDVVQPLLVSSLVFALPCGAWIAGQRVRRLDIGAAVLVVAALAVFVTVADPSGGRSNAPVGHWLLAGGACLIVCALLAVPARAAHHARRAALFGAGAGILFALSAALTKGVVDRLGGGLGHAVLTWELPALIAVGYVSMTLNQLSLDAGALAASVATSTSLDPIVSVVLGLTLFSEELRGGSAALAITVAALVVGLAGVLVLARAQPEPSGAAGTRGHAP